MLVKEPPAPPSDHTAEVAPPPYDPPKAAVVPPWQMADTAEPALAVGLGLTVTEEVLEVAVHPELLAVKV